MNGRGGRKRKERRWKSRKGRRGRKGHGSKNRCGRGYTSEDKWKGTWKGRDE